VVSETASGFISNIDTCRTDKLPAGDLLVKVVYSSLNYKDALSASGNKGVTGNYPHTPGIDAAGIIEHSAVPGFKSGDEVLITGFDLGMNTSGGFGGYVRVPAGWAMKLPAGLSLKDSMVLGTAGLTAGLSVYKLSKFVEPGRGLIAVSGSTGGVGSLALAILKKAGYQSVAITRKTGQQEYLKSLGADEIILNEELGEGGSRPMLKAVFAGGIDTVGGSILQNIIKSVSPLGAVTCCGNAASGKLELTVYPFILRGISLIGIDSQDCPVLDREKIWHKLSSEWRPDHLMDIYEEINLEELPLRIEAMLAGKSRGRVIVKH
jgi:putative YhdH/YhfP family quinone oxidoreductase